MSEDDYTAELSIPIASRGLRIDQALVSLLPDVSRTEIKRWILDGCIRMNNCSVKPSYRVKGNELVSVRGRRNNLMDWDSQQDVEFRVVHEDDDILVVDKPAGVVVHPGTGNTNGTLVNGLVAHRPTLSQLPRAGIVHRLDKDTSGLLVVAASKTAFGSLAEALSQRNVTRKYSCIVEGVMDSAQRVDLPIGRHAVHHTRQQVRQDGRTATTDFAPRELFRAHTHVHAQLSTGRTHQIRVHAQAIGHPLVGDKTYGARGRLPKTSTELLIERIRSFSRQALHASDLSFVHPVSHEPVRFRSEIPTDMRMLVQALQEDRDSLLDS